ncbi:hypothetical protein KH5_07820 [Urechidicola sp. KH5]
MKNLVVTLALFVGLSNFAQNISGTIINTDQQIIAGAHIKLVDSNSATISDKNGEFQLQIDTQEVVTIVVSHLGYKSQELNITASNIPITVTLVYDFLNLEEVVVTGTHIPVTNKDLSVPISTMDGTEITRFSTNGTAALLERVPGMYVDASAGEVFTRVYTRGVSVSAEDDLGWYYVGLHENGLPVTAVQFASFSPDLFHRIDNTLTKVETVRGGSAAITGMNTPGGVFNFISKPVSSYFQGEAMMNTGFHYNGNVYNKIDACVSGPITDRLGYQFGITHRYDQGSRDVDYNFGNGGQITYRLSYKFDSGNVELYGKYLNDNVNRATGVTAHNWDNPTESYGQDFRTTTQLLPNQVQEIPDGLGGTYTFDPAKGIQTKDFTIGALAKFDISNKWRLENNFKYSAKSALWNTSLSSAKLDLNGFLPYFIAGYDGFPIGQIVFRNTDTGNEVARVDNSGIFGNPPSFNYLTEGKLPYDAILGISAWYKDDSNDEFMNQLTFSGDLDKHQITAGIFAAKSKIDAVTRASFGYATYEALPKSLTVTIENPGSDIIQLSDEHGYSNYGGLFFEQADATVNQLHFFIQDQWKINEQWLVDGGIRINSINHDGGKYNPVPFTQDGGYDGNPLTGYDNGILTPFSRDNFDYNYTTISFSLGANYKVSDKLNAFARFSKGAKAPELDYYFSNFANVPINEEGPVQQIYQAELGVKFASKSFTAIPTLFYSQLQDVGFSNFVFDSDNNQIFYTPMQFNSTETFGLELESVYHPTNNFSIKANATIQSAKALDFAVYNANETIDPSDDEIISYNGNKLPFNPSFMLDITPEYHLKKAAFYANWRFMGAREGNVANSFQLPSYSVFNAGASYQLSNHFNVGLQVKNIFNSEGLMNFYGPNFFGGSKDAATKEYIEANPDGDFIVTPIQARMIHATLRYNF